MFSSIDDTALDVTGLMFPVTMVSNVSKNILNFKHFGPLSVIIKLLYIWFILNGRKCNSYLAIIISDQAYTKKWVLESFTNIFNNA